MNPNLLVVQSKVQKILSNEFNHVEIDKDGDFTFRHESARVFVRVWTPADDGPVYITVTCPLLFNVKPTPELFKYIALHADDYVFGHLSASETEDGIMVTLAHSLLGDYLDQDELVRGCAGVLFSGNEIDDDLKARFGGTLFHEE